MVLLLAGASGFLQMTLLLNKFAHTWLILCVKNVSEREALLPTKCILCNQRSL